MASDGSDDTLDGPSPRRSRGAPTAVLADVPGLVADPMLAASGRERYQTGSVVGHGGMGEVLLGVDRQIGRDVAIKRMRQPPTPESVARFLREARIQGRLEHPAIVPVHEVWIEGDGRPRFAMKHLTGTTLADVVTALGRGEPEAVDRYTRVRLLDAFASVCLAIEFAHTRGVIHRDLKPANIMLGDFGEVYVLDWGIAKQLEDTSPETSSETDAGGTQLGAAIGTPGYMAPEQTRGERVDARADTYALGCILFEILTHRALQPRGAATPADRKPSAIDPEVPPELDALCVAATAPDRADRIPTARQLADGVRRFLDGDRDLALRRQLSAEHLTAARAAIARGDGEADRRAAIQEAGRALALDPKAADAASLVSRLMLEPPREIPREVERELDALERVTVQRTLRDAKYRYVAVLLAIALLIPMGVKHYWFLGVLAAVVVANMIQMHVRSLSGTLPTPSGIAVTTILHLLMLGMMSYAIGPIFVIPMALQLVVGWAIHPMHATWLLCSTIPIVALGPWLLELMRISSATLHTTDAGLLITSPVVRFELPGVHALVVVSAIGFVVSIALQIRRTIIVHRARMRVVELQAWHLRQLMPASHA